MKKTLERINFRKNKAEGQFNDLEDKVAENTQSEQQNEKNNLKK